MRHSDVINELFSNSITTVPKNVLIYCKYLLVYLKY